MKILQKKCPYCNKIISSMYDQQLKQNYDAHIMNCKQKIKR
jgi:hypothetical protein